MLSGSVATAHLPTRRQSPSYFLTIGALGIVFGDIGTSPLYTFNTVLQLSGGGHQPDTVLGVLSLLFWTLILVTSIKYATLAMRINNQGEGGILALMSLLKDKVHTNHFIIFAGLFGAALIYGDGAITPAISVLSALEGLKLIVPEMEHFILPATIIILSLLFAIQRFGTASISKLFGPVMVLWFTTLALLGINSIIEYPAVLLALNPWYGLSFLIHNGYTSLVILGGVFLCVTGAEALYADMGHFGKKPIWLSWYAIVLPSLFLNYAGQAGFILTHPTISNNIFYRLCPTPLQVPLIILATLATIIASQAIITGAFSMTRQAMQLGWLPRMRIKQTTNDNYGQIYIGTVNWLLMIVTLSLVVMFKSSENLASAYGIAVSLTMLMTSCLLFIAMRRIWHWGKVISILVASVFLLIDGSFVIANITKLMNGGYIPLILALIILLLMSIWKRGVNSVIKNLNEKPIAIDDFLAMLKKDNIPRVVGTGIFMTQTPNAIPTVMNWHVKRNHVLHKNLLTLTIVVVPVPRIPGQQRIQVKRVANKFWQVTATYGFMERPNVPKLLERLYQYGIPFDFSDATYYIGHETIISKEHGGLPEWQRSIFAFMVRNSSHVTDYYSLPHNQLIEIGRQVRI